MVALAIILFAIVITIIGGNDPNAAQLYYDADFVELYETDKKSQSAATKSKGPDANSSGEGEVTTSVMTTNTVKEDASDADAIPTTLEGDGDIDPRMLSQEVYADIKL